MRAVIQRVTSAQVSIAGQTAGTIGVGLVVLLGIATGDTVDDAAWLARKIAELRIFPDDTARMNRSVRDCGGQVMIVSQFTLLASTRKGTRPSFNAAARPEEAVPLYQNFIAAMEAHLGHSVVTGQFGADMAVQLVNDGPVTLVIDSRQKE